MGHRLCDEDQFSEFQLHEKLAETTFGTGFTVSLQLHVVLKPKKQIYYKPIPIVVGLQYTNSVQNESEELLLRNRCFLCLKPLENADPNHNTKCVYVSLARARAAIAKVWRL